MPGTSPSPAAPPSPPSISASSPPAPPSAPAAPAAPPAPAAPSPPAAPAAATPPSTPAAPAPAPAAPAKAPRPEWCPEKFWDSEKGEPRTEALARSFSEVERLASQQRGPQTAHQQLADAQKKQPDLIRRAKEDFLKHDGKLSEAMYREVEAAGFGTKADIDGLMEMYAREQAHLYDQANAAIFAGNLEGALAFAHSDAMPAKARERIDALMDDPDTMEIGLFALKAMYDHHAAGHPTAVLQWGDPAAPAPGDVFASEDEYLKACEDPKYGRDREFTAAVDAKMQRSVPRWQQVKR